MPRHLCAGAIPNTFVACGEEMVAGSIESRQFCSSECRVRAAFREAGVEGLIRMGAPPDEYDHEADDSLRACRDLAERLGEDVPPTAATICARVVLHRAFGTGVDGKGRER